MYQGQYGPPQQVEHPHRTPKTHPSYQCMILGTKRRTLPQNPSFWIIWKQVQQQVWQRFFQFQAEEQLRLYPGQGLNFQQKKSTTPDLSLKLGKDGELTPQEHQCCLDNKLCLFCGTTGHVTKDCPKSSSASAKARVSKSDQDESASSSMDSKKD